MRKVFDIMKLIFVGPQGSGKGTQAKRVAKKFGLCHISTGDLLREVGGDLKAEVDKIMEQGELISDELIVKILKEKLSGEDRLVLNGHDSGEPKGFILDGFPRNARQAEMLEKITGIDKVVEIAISDDEAVKRVCGRRGCVKCGAIYNVNTSPKPSVEGVCDKCGDKLIQRKDDNKEALRERLKVYHKETEEILKMYDSFRIDGSGSIEEVFGDILLVIESN